MHYFCVSLIVKATFYLKEIAQSISVVSSFLFNSPGLDIHFNSHVCPHPQWEGGWFGVRVSVESTRFPKSELVAETHVFYFPWERYGNGRREPLPGAPVHTITETWFEYFYMFRGHCLF
jgi:hypothetical protein